MLQNRSWSQHVKGSVCIQQTDPPRLFSLGKSNSALGKMWSQRLPPTTIYI